LQFTSPGDALEIELYSTDSRVDDALSALGSRETLEKLRRRQMLFLPGIAGERLLKEIYTAPRSSTC